MKWKKHGMLSVLQGLVSIISLLLTLSLFLGQHTAAEIFAHTCPEFSRNVDVSQIPVQFSFMHSAVTQRYLYSKCAGRLPDCYVVFSSDLFAHFTRKSVKTPQKKMWTVQQDWCWCMALSLCFHHGLKQRTYKNLPSTWLAIPPSHYCISFCVCFNCMPFE